MKIPRSAYIEEDVLLVHKPKGITSFDLVREMRKILGIRKIGHAGTLDPLAHGLMILGIASGTKKMQRYLKLPKTYITDIIIGESRTSADLEGELVEKKKIFSNDLSPKDIEDELVSLKGKHRMLVPRYSAIKVEGKPLYWYAREGKEPPYIPEKEMEILDIQFLDYYLRGDTGILSLRISVSSGTYIRSLAELIGHRLGYPACLKELYRLAIADFHDTKSFRLEKNKRVGILRSLFAYFGK